MIHVEHSFGTRFGYLLWRWHLIHGEAPSYAFVAKQVGRTGPAVSAWRKAKDAPTDYRVREALTQLFEFGEWLLEETGEAPEPEQFKLWIRHRRAEAKPLSPAAFKQVTRADVKAAKKNRGKGSA